MSKSNIICAGIVLYNPDLARLKENVDSISNQVDDVFCIDNMSSNISDVEELLRQYHNIHLLRNNKNYGIARALNQLLKIGNENNYNWIITLDQDSVAPYNLVSEYEKYINLPSLGIICPRIDDVNLKSTKTISPCVSSISCATDLITSGSCLNISKSINIFGFDEQFFIDFVDTDFQQRMLLSDAKIIRLNNVVLKHSVGKISSVKFLTFNFICTNHSASRRYFMARNRLFFRKKYFGYKGYFFELIRLLLGCVKVLFFESDKINKVLSTLKGIYASNKFHSDNIQSLFKKNLSFSIILPNISGTGGINVLYEYGRRLMRDGHKVSFYIPIFAYNLHQNCWIYNFLKQIYATCKVLFFNYFMNNLYIVRSSQGVNIRLVPTICNTCLPSADIVVASAWCTAYDVAKLYESKGRKIYFVQDYEVWDNEKLGKLSYKLPLHKIAIASWIKEKLVKECDCSYEEIDIIHNGVDLTKYIISDSKRKHINNPSCQDMEINCLMLDHQLARKGVDIGIQAFNVASKKYPGLNLVLFGLKKSDSVPEGYTYFENPSIETLVNLYNSADIFIFPSLEEGWGLTPVEAMACGCCVVGSNVGCMQEIGKNRYNALLSDPGNISQLADNILILASDSNLRSYIAQNGLNTVKLLDWNVSVKKFENICFKCVENN